VEKTIPRWLGLGWHWFWFLPLCAVVLLLIERHMVVYAFLVLKLGWQRWTWGGLLSPSMALCIGVICASVVGPLYGLGSVASLVAARQQWRWAILLIVVILLFPFVTDTLIWGSFPFTFDNEGVARLRMIPFIPWPSGSYLEY
jgi:hypothetical protein